MESISDLFRGLVTRSDLMPSNGMLMISTPHSKTSLPEALYPTRDAWGALAAELLKEDDKAGLGVDRVLRLATFLDNMPETMRQAARLDGIAPFADLPEGWADRIDERVRSSTWAGVSSFYLEASLKVASAKVTQSFALPQTFRSWDARPEGAAFTEASLQEAERKLRAAMDRTRTKMENSLFSVLTGSTPYIQS